MHVGQYESINPNVISALRQGKTLVISETGNLRRATWGERIVRWINWSKAAQQDKDVADWLVKHLNNAQGAETYPNTLEVVAKYAKACQRTDEAFKRLENTVFAHKCHVQLPSLQVDDLIKEDGTPTHELLNFLKSNSLHYVIPKANAEHKNTALLIASDQVYIRAKEGQSFLDTPDHIKFIQERLPKGHADESLLKELHGLLVAQKIAIHPNQAFDVRIEEIRHELEPSHYYYQSLQDIQRDGKGLLVSQSYLADGIEDFEHRHWNELKPNFREKTNQPSYKLRIITRLPAYALEKTWFGTITTLLRNIFDFRAHGHSWVELVEPVSDDKGKTTNEQNIYNVGYYFHPLDRQKRFESADPMAYMPIPSEQIFVEEIEISKEQFDKAQLYIKEVQTLVDNPNRQLNDKPVNQNLTRWEKEEIQYLYKSTLKSTCLTFANVLKEVVTGIAVDNRGGLRRQLAAKNEFKRWDRIDGFVEKTFLLRWMIRIPRFLLRMELPFWVKQHQSPPSSPQPIKHQDNDQI